MRSRLVASALSAVLLVAALPAGPAAAFQVGYDYYCYATNSDGIPIMDDAYLPGESYVDGDYVKTGDHGNYGSAAFSASIATVTVSVLAHSHGLQTGPYTFPSGTGRVERSAFQDRLTFTVPAGDYPEGVAVTVYGTALGSLGAEVGAGAQVRCQASFGSEQFDTGLLEVGVGESGTILVDESFALTAQLVAPGGNLTQGTDYDELVTVGIYNGRTWSTSYNPGGGSVIGDGDISFPDGLRLVALKVPPGVGWSSESGVFPFLPTGVPGGAAVADRPRLEQNHPNPFNPRTTIRYVLPRAATVDLRVFDLAGRLVRSLVAGQPRAEGPHAVDWRGRDEAGHPVPSGVYLYRLRVGDREVTRRMLLVR